MKPEVEVTSRHVTMLPNVLITAPYTMKVPAMVKNMAVIVSVIFILKCIQA